MKTYRNTKTGATLMTTSRVGGDWELVTGQSDDMTVPEIKSKLTELGIEFEQNAKKADLLALLPE